MTMTMMMTRIEPGEKCEKGPKVEGSPLTPEFYYRYNPTLLNYGFNAPGNATTLCGDHTCLNVVNYQVSSSFFLLPSSSLSLSSNHHQEEGNKRLTRENERDSSVSIGSSGLEFNVSHQRGIVSPTCVESRINMIRDVHQRVASLNSASTLIHIP